MRNLSNQSYAALRMSAVFCVVVRISVNVGVDNGYSVDNMQMGK